jgi:hypothetical protein
MHNTAGSLSRSESDHTAAPGGCIRQYGARAGDNALEPNRCLIAAAERPCRPDIRRHIRVGGEQSGDAILFLLVEKPIGKGGKIEEARHLVLYRIGRATSLPQEAIGHLVRLLLSFSFSSHHRNAFLSSLRVRQRKHPRNLSVLGFISRRH